MGEEKKKSPVLFIAFALLISVWGAYSYLTYIPNSFPALDKGFYVGTVSGLDGDENYKATFYTEISEFSKEPLFIIFNKGWMPQTEKIESIFNNKGEKIAFSPVFLEKNNAAYKFTGKKENQTYTGVVEYLGGVGSWELKPVALAELTKKQSSISSYDIPTDSWLGTRTKQWDISRELKSLSKEEDQNKNKIARYQQLLEQHEVLKENATKLEVDLQENLKASLKNERNSDTSLSERASEAGLLNRITQYGKIVRLARKVARREHKWYLANWDSDKISSIPNSLKSTYKNKASFEMAVKEADEKQELLRQIAYEQERIAHLNGVVRGEANGDANERSNGGQVWKRVLW